MCFRNTELTEPLKTYKRYWETKASREYPSSRWPAPTGFKGKVVAAIRNSAVKPRSLSQRGTISPTFYLGAPDYPSTATQSKSTGLAQVRLKLVTFLSLTHEH